MTGIDDRVREQKKIVCNEMYLLAKANCVKSRAWEVHKMKEKKTLIARRKKSSLSVVNTAERERENFM